MEAYNNTAGSSTRGVTNSKSAAAKYYKKRHPKGPQPSQLANKTAKRYTPRSERS